tara:strand:- start:25 stop:1617 length:1593 start_codon:yes stop_codon:yes gene_type:complete
MKNYLLPNLFLLFFFWSCEEEIEPQPQDCAGVDGGQNICGCTDTSAINFESTATFDDGSCQYDTIPPSQVLIDSITYDLNGMYIYYQTPMDEDFSYLQLFYSNEEQGEKFLISQLDSGTVTNLTFEEYENLIDPTNPKWYWIKAFDIDGNSSIGPSYYLFSNYPTEATAYEVQFNEGSYSFSWGKNNDADFYSYMIFRSSAISMVPDLELFTEIKNIDSTSIPITIGGARSNIRWYYQIHVKNSLGLTTKSNIIEGDYCFEFFNRCWSVYQTLNLNPNSDADGFTEIPEDIQYLVNLEKLELDGHDFFGEIPEFLGNLDSLYFIDLGYNNFSGEIPNFFENLPNLRILRLGGNNLSGQIPSSIGNLHGLIILDLSQNNLTGSLPEELGNLSKLEYLNIQNNYDASDNTIRLYGEIPSSFGMLDSIKHINIQANNFIGNIDWIESLLKLEEFQCSFNQFDGTIPEGIGNLSELMIFKALDNNISGTIPESICNLSQSFFSNGFEVSGNNLCPPYPDCVEAVIFSQDTTDCD